MKKIYILYKKLIIFLYKNKIIKDKIKLLKNVDINFYNPEWAVIEQNFLYNNIINEIQILKNINNLNVNTDRIVVETNNIRQTYSVWYSDEGYVIQSDIFYVWLEEVRKIFLLNSKININNHITQYNQMKIRGLENYYNNTLNNIIFILKI